MTDPFATIRAQAEATLEDAAHPVHPMAGPHDREIALARFAIAVMEALEDHAFLEATLLEAFHHDDMGADVAESIRDTIARKLESGHG